MISFQLIKLIQPFSCFFNQTEYADIRICIGLDFFLFVLPVVSRDKETSMGAEIFNSGQRNLWKKSITILFRYKINQRQIQQMDPIAINRISNGQQLIFMGQTTLSAMQVVMVILHPMKIITILSKHLLWVLYMSYVL